MLPPIDGCYGACELWVEFVGSYGAASYESKRDRLLALKLDCLFRQRFLIMLSPLKTGSASEEALEPTSLS